MEIITFVGQSILSFAMGTLILWGVSHTVKTEHANLKTAAIYNGIMTLIDGVLLGGANIVLKSESGFGAAFFTVLSFAEMIVLFWLLKRLYVIRFLATIWLFIAMLTVGFGVGMLYEYIF